MCATARQQTRASKITARSRTTFGARNWFHVKKPPAQCEMLTMSQCESCCLSRVTNHQK